MKSVFVLVLCLSALTIFGFRIEYTGDSVNSKRFQNILEDHTEVYQIETTSTNEYNTNGTAIEHNETLANEQRLEVKNLFQINEEDTTDEVATTGIIDISENLVQSDNETRTKDGTANEINEELQQIYNHNQATSTTSVGQLTDRAGANFITETSTQYPKASTFINDDDICDDITEENKNIPSDSLIQLNQQTLTRISDVENENIPVPTAENEASPVTDDITFDETGASSSSTTEAGDAPITNEGASKSVIDDIITQSRQPDFLSDIGTIPNQESDISTFTENIPPSTEIANAAGEDINIENQDNILNQPYFGSFESNLVDNGISSTDNALKNNENTQQTSAALDQTTSVNNLPTTSSENASDQVVGTDVTSTTTIKYEDQTTPTQEVNKIIPTGFSTAGIPIFSANTFNNFGTVPTTETTILPSTTPVSRYQENFGKLSATENQQNLFGNGFYQGNLGTVTDAPSTTKYQNNFGTTIFEDQPNLHRFGFGTKFNGFTFNQPAFSTTTLRNDVSSTTLDGFNFTPTQSYTDTPVSNFGIEVITNRNPFATSSQRTSVVILNESSTLAPPFTTSTQTTLDTNINNQYDLFTGIQTTPPSEITSTSFAPVRGNVATAVQPSLGQFNEIQTIPTQETISTTFSPIRGNVAGVITPPPSNLGAFNRFGDQNAPLGLFTETQTTPPSKTTSNTFAPVRENGPTAIQPSLGQFNEIQTIPTQETISTTFSPIRGNVAGVITPPPSNLGAFNRFGDQNAPLGLFTETQTTPPSKTTSNTFAPVRENGPTAIQPSLGQFNEIQTIPTQETISTTFSPIRGNVAGVITPPPSNLGAFNRFGDQNARLGLFTEIQTTPPSKTTSNTFAPVRENGTTAIQPSLGQFNEIQTIPTQEITSTTFSPIRGNVAGVITPPQSNLGAFNRFGDQNARLGLFTEIQTTPPSETTSNTFAPVRENGPTAIQPSLGQFNEIQTIPTQEITSTTFSPIRGNVAGVITPPQSNLGAFNKFGDQNTRLGLFTKIQTTPPSENTATIFAPVRGNVPTAVQPSLGQFNKVETIPPQEITSTTFSPIRGNVAGVITPPQSNLGAFNKFGDQNARLGLFTGVQKTPSSETASITFAPVRGSVTTAVQPSLGQFNKIQTIPPPEITSSTFSPIRGNVAVTPGAITPPHPSLELFSKFGDQESRLPPTMDRGKATLSDIILPPKEGRLESTTEGLVQAIFSGQISFDNSTNSKPKKGSFFNLQNLGGFNLLSVTRNTIPANSFQRTSKPPLPPSLRPTIQKPANVNPQFSLGVIDRYTSSNLKIDTVNLGKTGSINRLGDSSKTTFFNGLHLYNPSFATFLK